MGAEMSQMKKAELAKQIPDLIKIQEHHHDADLHQNKIMTKSQSAHTHFSDFSMFPDRFNDKKSSLPKPIMGQNHLQDENIHHSFADHHSNQNNSVPTSASSGFISRYNFGLRRSSESSETGQDQSSLDDPPPRSGRARSLSNSKLYYFDFSLIPDKDPHCVQKECLNSNRFLRVVQEEHLGATSQSAPAQESLMMAVAEEAQQQAIKAKRVRKTSESRFGFFDYSMIPDKDPRCFATKNPPAETKD